MIISSPIQRSTRALNTAQVTFNRRFFSGRSRVSSLTVAGTSISSLEECNIYSLHALDLRRPKVLTHPSKATTTTTTTTTTPFLLTPKILTDLPESVPRPPRPGHRPLLVVVFTTPGHPIQLAPTASRLAQSLLALAARVLAAATAGGAGLQRAAVSPGDQPCGQRRSVKWDH